MAILVLLHLQRHTARVLRLYHSPGLYTVFPVNGISLCVVTFAKDYDDAIQAISLETMALFYVSPVFYNIDLVPKSIRMFYLFNPMALLLNLYHDSLYRGNLPRI